MKIHPSRPPHCPAARQECFFLFSLLLGLSQLPALPAQGEEESGVSGPPPMNITVRSRWIGSADIAGGNATVTSTWAGVSTLQPFPIGEKLQGSLLIGADTFSYDFGNFSQTTLGIASPLRAGHLLEIAPGVSYVWNPNCVLIAGVNWRFAAAHDAGTGAAGQWGGIVGALYQLRPGITLVGGIIAGERLDHATLVFPFIGVEWSINERWQLSLTGNSRHYEVLEAELVYHPEKSWNLFFRSGFEDRIIRLSPNSTIPGGTLRHDATTLKAGFAWHPTASLTVSLHAGYYLSQKYRFKDQSRRELARYSAEAAPVAGLLLEQTF